MLASGQETLYEVAVAAVEAMGQRIGATIIFGEDDCESILGLIALGSAGIELDSSSRRFKKLPVARVKTLRGQKR